MNKLTKKTLVFFPACAGWQTLSAKYSSYWLQIRPILLTR